MKITDDKIEFRNSDEYQDDDKFLKVIENINKQNLKYIKEYNQALKEIANQSFIFIENAELEAKLSLIRSRLTMLNICVQIIINKYQVQQNSLNEIKNILLDKNYDKKLIEKLFN